MVDATRDSHSPRSVQTVSPALLIILLNVIIVINLLPLLSGEKSPGMARSIGMITFITRPRAADRELFIVLDCPIVSAVMFIFSRNAGSFICVVADRKPSQLMITVICAVKRLDAKVGGMRGTL